MEKIILIDGNSILNRAFYGVPILTNSKGVYTNAIYGFLNIMFKIIDDENPSYLLVCFDTKAKTFRHDLFVEYKGTRKGMPEELAPQLGTMKDVLESMNIPIFTMEGVEADDLLGTLAKSAENLGMQPVIVSGDKDLLQLATDNIKIKIPKSSKGQTTVKDYFAKDVLEEFSVTPTEFIDLKGLMGDQSDNVPGVPGVGIKTATKIIVEYKTIENALDNIDKVMPKKARENLLEYKEQALLSKFLVTIKTDCDVELIKEDVVIENLWNDNAYELFKELELKSYFKKFESEKSSGEKSVQNKVEYTVIDNPFDLEIVLPELLNADKLAYYIVMEDDNLLYISMCKNDGFVYIFSVFLGLLDALRPVFSGDVKKVSYNYKNDLAFFDRRGIELNNVCMDTSVCAYVINPSRENYNYDTLAIDFLDEYVTPLDDILLKGKSRKSIESLEADTRYELIATITDILYRVSFVLLQKVIDEEKEHLIFDIEMALSEVLYVMEKEGIFVDRDKLEKYGEKLTIELDNLTSQIVDLAGEEFNINSPKQLGVILFEKLQLVATKKTKTGYSTNNDVLEKLVDKHPIISPIMSYRTYKKLKTTYVDGLLNVISLDNKIHSTFNQTITATGRISSTEPNLQNIPTRLPLGRELRKVFLPTNDNYVFLDADYNQIELRVLAHLSGDETLIDAFNNNVDIHTLTASEVFHVPFDKVTSEQRSNAKAVNFGIVYGIGSFSLSQDLSITKKEADRYIEGYFKKYPKVKDYLEGLISFAEENGYAKTMLNRTRNIKEINDKNFNVRSFAQRIAMNMPIQGTSADIIKIAMVNVYNRLKEEKLDAKIILQVHDELLLEVNKKDIDRVKEILIYEMENTIMLKVPLLVSVSVGNSWYELK